MGLTLARRLTEMHGGRLEAFSSGPGQGSEFVCRLPLVAGEPAAEASTRPAPAHVAVRRRILLVDDNTDSAEALAELLEADGRDVRVAVDGPSALRAVPEFRPEVVLLDIGLPGMDGYEVARRLRADEESEGVVLVALTGYGLQEHRRRAEDAGFDHHLVKPIRPDALLAILRRFDAGAPEEHDPTKLQPSRASTKDGGE